jgi:hypothetical protein
MTPEIRYNDSEAWKIWQYLFPIGGASAETVKQNDRLTLSLIHVANRAAVALYFFHSDTLLSIQRCPRIDTHYFIKNELLLNKNSPG